MEKELKSYTGVLLRADLTGHGHPPHFGRKGLNGHALLGQPSKGHPCRILILFSMIFYCIISTTYQKIGALFFPVHICGLSHIVYGAELQLGEKNYGTTLCIPISLHNMMELTVDNVNLKTHAIYLGNLRTLIQFARICT